MNDYLRIVNREDYLSLGEICKRTLDALSRNNTGPSFNAQTPLSESRFAFLHAVQGHSRKFVSEKSTNQVFPLVSVADYCCKTKDSTRVVKTFFESRFRNSSPVPQFSFTGIDLLLPKDQDREEDIFFKKQDVYSAKYALGDIVLSYRACGLLSDKIISLGIKSGSPIIGGVGCCYLHYRSIEWEQKLRGPIRRWTNYKAASLAERVNGGSFMCPLKTFPLVSEYVADLGLDSDALIGLVQEASGLRNGIRAATFNRLLRLYEAGYAAFFDSRTHTYVGVKQEFVQ